MYRFLKIFSNNIIGRTLYSIVIKCGDETENIIFLFLPANNLLLKCKTYELVLYIWVLIPQV